MKAQIVLTPTESKKLIAKAILRLKEVQSALEKGIIVLHPSSSTVFLYKEILDRWPQGAWVCGVIVQRGLCLSREGLGMVAARGLGKPDPRQFPLSWFLKDGVLQEQTPLGDILDEMKAKDVYIKGANALDIQGNVGVLYSNPGGGGGTIGKVIGAQRKKGFHLLLPIGFEKLIPVSIAIGRQKAGHQKVDRAMGLPCGLIRVRGRKIDEIDAFEILSGTQATPIAAGGLGGAEGSIVLVLHGTDGEIQSALEVTQTVKGAQLPALNLLDCDSCTHPTCHLVRDTEKKGEDE